MHLSVLQEGVNQGEPRVGVGSSSGTVRCCSRTQRLGFCWNQGMFRTSQSKMRDSQSKLHSTFVSRKTARNHPRLGSSGLSHGCRFGFVLEGEEHQRQRPGLVTTGYLTVVHAIWWCWAVAVHKSNVQEEKNQQLPTSAQSELTATLSLLRIRILRTSYTALSIWPIDRPSRKDFLVAIVLKQLNNCRTHVGFSAKSALEHHHLSHALWEHCKHQTRSLGTSWKHLDSGCIAT